MSRLRKVTATELKRLLDERQVSLSCPMCGHNDWNWDQSFRVLMQIDVDKLELKMDKDLLPVLPLICKSCGFVALFHPVILGLAEGD